MRTDASTAEAETGLGEPWQDPFRCATWTATRISLRIVSPLLSPSQASPVALRSGSRLGVSLDVERETLCMKPEQGWVGS